MIVIDILNIEQLVEKHRGPFTAMLGQIGRVDLEGKVEAVIIEEIKKALEANDVEAKILSVGGVKSTTYTNP